jgi:hypothetical protein
MDRTKSDSIGLKLTRTSNDQIRHFIRSIFAKIIAQILMEHVVFWISGTCTLITKVPTFAVSEYTGETSSCHKKGKYDGTSRYPANKQTRYDAMYDAMVLKRQSLNSMYTDKSLFSQCCSVRQLRRGRSHLESCVVIFLFVNIGITSSLWFMISKSFERTSRSFSFPLFQDVKRRKNSLVSSIFDPWLFHSQPASIVFQHRFHKGSRYGSIVAPPLIYFTDDDWEPDYNDLDFDSLDWRNFRRSIRRHLEEFDPTSLAFVTQNTLLVPSAPICRRMPWQSFRFPVCNIVHEVELDVGRNAYLG